MPPIAVLEMQRERTHLDEMLANRGGAQHNADSHQPVEGSSRVAAALGSFLEPSCAKKLLLC